MSVPATVEKEDIFLRLDIDKYRLDEEWAGQPKMVQVWCEQVADAQLALDNAKSEYKLTCAELDKAIRDSPAEYGLVKTTDAVVEQTVVLQPEHQAAERNVSKAKHHLAIVSAAVEGLQQRKRAMSLLVDLWVKEYYSDVRQRAEDLTDEERAAVRSRGANRRRLMQREEEQETKAEDKDE